MVNTGVYHLKDKFIKAENLKELVVQMPCGIYSLCAGIETGLRETDKQGLRQQVYL